MNHTKSAATLAHLALQLTQTTPPRSTAPSLEELAAMLNQQVSDHRRAEIFSHIANDPGIYRQWLRCVETHATLAALPTEPEPTTAATESDKWPFSFWQWSKKCIEFLKLKQSYRWTTGFATAAVLVLAITLWPLQNDRHYIEGLDEQFNQLQPLLVSWNQFEHKKLVKPKRATSRSFFSPPPAKTPDQPIIEAGFYTMAQHLGTDKLAVLGVSINQLTQSINNVKSPYNKTQTEGLYHLGRFAALTLTQCELPTETQNYQALHQIAIQITAAILSIQDLALTTEIQDFRKTQSTQPATCGFALTIAQYLHQ